MCLPINFLKIWVSVVAGILNVVLGITLIVVAILTYDYNTEQFNSISSSAKTVRNAVAGTFLGLGILMLLTGASQIRMLAISPPGLSAALLLG